MPAKHARALTQTYAQVAEGYNQRNADNLDAGTLQKFAAELPTGATVLDLGCGHGRDSRWLVDHGFQVTMFDLSPEMLELAKAKVPEATAIQGDMTEMQFEPSSFDGVWASASILHLTKSEAKKVIQDVYQILRAEGAFYCLLKKGEGEVEINDDKYGTPMTRFFAFYQEQEVQELLQNIGFAEIQVWSSKSQSGQEWVEAIARKK